MRISATKLISVATIAAVAALGAQYASAAPSPVAGSQKGQAQVAPIRNIAYLYSSGTTGGTGDVVYSIPNPPAGFYAASFTANFYPEGSPAAPKTFSCSLIKGGTLMRAQSTVTTTYSSGFYAGVNGGNTIHVAPGDSWALHCGTADGSDWSWGTRPGQVTLTRLDGQVAGNLTETLAKKGSLGVVAAR